MPALRRHRLAEVFQVKVMTFGWGEAHELTDGFELGIDQRLVGRVDQLTGFPWRCPQGGPIPTRKGAIKFLNDRALQTFQSENAGYIRHVRMHDDYMLRYLPGK